MNAPNRFELYVLGEGEQKLTVEEDTKIPNAATITINKEDHTLANMLRSQLLQLPYVLFAGYKVPHPLEPRVQIKVQTDNSSTPIQAVQKASNDLIVTLSKLRDAMEKEFDTARAMGTSTGLEGFNLPGSTAGGAAPGTQGVAMGLQAGMTGQGTLEQEGLGSQNYTQGTADEPSGFGEFVM